MKKTILAAVLMFAVFTALYANDENKRNAARHVWEGDYYVFQFQQFMADPNAAIVSKPGWITEQTPSTQDIDRAIAAYEAALRLEPTGTWQYSRNADVVNWMLPPAEGVRARLENAQRMKPEIRNVERVVLGSAVADVRTAGQSQASHDARNNALDRLNTIRQLPQARERINNRQYAEAITLLEQAINSGHLNETQTRDAQTLLEEARRELSSQ